MAQTTSRDAQWQPGEVVTYATGTAANNPTIHAGALVCVAPTTGALVPASDTANLRFVGVALDGGKNGQRVRVRKTGVVTLAWGGTPGAASADIGKSVCALADDSVALEAGTTNDIVVGTLVAVEGGGATVRVRVDNAVR